MSSSSESSSQAVSYGRGVRVRRFAQARYTAGAVDGFRFTAEAYGNHRMPLEVFRFLRGPGPTPASEADRFDGVCSPVDLEELPAGAPDAGPVRFYRRAVVDLVFRSQAEAEEAWLAIDGELRVLVRTLDLMDELTVTLDAQYGTPPPADPPTGPPGDSGSSSGGG